MGQKRAPVYINNILAGIDANESGSSLVVNLKRGASMSCQVAYDVSGSGLPSKNFTSPGIASITVQDVGSPALRFTSRSPGVAGNNISVEFSVPFSGTNPLQVFVTGDTINVSLETIRGTNASTALSFTNPVTVESTTSQITAEDRNGNSIATFVNPAAANPTDTILIDVSGAAGIGALGSIEFTITPNNGDNNLPSRDPVDLTTAEFAEFLNTGVVAGKNIVVSDPSNLLVLTPQIASGGGSEVFASGGEGDSVIAYYADGVNIISDLTTSEACKDALDGSDAVALIDTEVLTSGYILVAAAPVFLEGGIDGDVFLDTSTVVIPSHGYSNGQEVTLTTTDTLPEPLMTSTSYYLIVVDANTLKFAATLSDALSNIPITLITYGPEESVHTINPVGGSSSASLSFYGSNDAHNWTLLEPTTNIISDGSVMFSQPAVAFLFFKVVKEIVSGEVAMTANTIVVGDPNG